MTKKERFEHINNIFQKVYPEAACSLNYSSPFELLIATLMSAQCTDKRVNIVTKTLFEKYKGPIDFMNANLNELMNDIRSTGFYRNKAKNIIALSTMIVEKFDGIVPDNLEDITSLPGVGRKTGNLVLGDIYGIPGMVIDTHAKRVLYRTGLTNHKDPTKIEFDVQKLIPDEFKNKFSHQLVTHGREYCDARNPLCIECPIKEYCKKRVKK